MFFNIIYMIGGLALFLYGVQESTRIFRYNLGSSTRELMVRFTRKKWQAFTFGVLLSAVTQSSTIATSFAVGFVDVGMLSFAGSVVVMMGASLGGTFVSFLLNLDVVSFAPLMFAAAFFMSKVKRGGLNKFAGIIQGVSLILLGMLILKLGTTPLLANNFVRKIILEHSSDFFTMGLISCAAAGIFQSSPAVIALGIALAASGVLPSQSALPIALGAHIGSTTMVLIAGLSGRQSAKRLGIATFIYKIIGALVFIPIIPFVHDKMIELGAATSDILVYGQVLIAVLNVALFYPLSGAFAAVVARCIGGRGNLSHPKYLDDDMLHIPVMSVLLLSKEMIRLANYLEAYFQMLLYPELRPQHLYAALPEAIEQLTDDCREYMYRICVPAESDSMLKRYSTITYTMAIFSDMGKLLTNGLRKCMNDETTPKELSSRLGAKTWCALSGLSLKILRTSLRAFVIQESGLIDEVNSLEAKFASISRDARKCLSGGSFYGRDASKIIHLISLLQGLAGMSKEVVQGEEFAK